MLEGCSNCRFGDLGEGLDYGRGTGPGYWHERTAKVTFPKAPPTQFTPNETVWVAESPDMFYGLDGLGLTELSVERYQEDPMLSRIDPLPPTGASTIFARADHDLVGPGVRWGTQAAALQGFLPLGPNSLIVPARDLQELVKGAGGKIKIDGVWGPASNRALLNVAIKKLGRDAVEPQLIKEEVIPFARGRKVMLEHDIIRGLAQWMGQRQTGVLRELQGLGQVRWPTAGRWSRGRTAMVPRPTFAPRPRLAPMVSPASLARAQKRQKAVRALRRRRTAQIKAAQKIQRAVARWR